MSKSQIICFGGGKDSLALLHLMRDSLDDTLVVFGDTGAIYPHMREFVHETCVALGVELKVVQPEHSVLDWIKAMGAPADMVPVDYTEEMQSMLRFRKQPLIQSRMLCCSVNLWTPVHRFIESTGIKRVYRGAKACDDKRGIGPRTSIGDIVIEAPLWDWDDAKVFNFLQVCDATLPEHYAKVNTSFDCYCCSAYLTDAGASGRIAYTKKHYPDLYPVLEQNIESVSEAITETLVDTCNTLKIGHP